MRALQNGRGSSTKCFPRRSAIDPDVQQSKWGGSCVKYQRYVGRLRCMDEFTLGTLRSKREIEGIDLDSFARWDMYPTRLSHVSATWIRVTLLQVLRQKIILRIASGCAHCLWNKYYSRVGGSRAQTKLWINDDCHHPIPVKVLCYQWSWAVTRNILTYFQTTEARGHIQSQKYGDLPVGQPKYSYSS